VPPQFKKPVARGLGTVLVRRADGVTRVKQACDHRQRE